MTMLSCRSSGLRSALKVASEHAGQRIKMHATNALLSAFSELENDHEVWAVAGVQLRAGVRLRAGIPSPTGAGVRVRRSIWARLSWAPARLILSASASPSQPLLSASALRPAGL